MRSVLANVGTPPKSILPLRKAKDQETEFAWAGAVREAENAFFGRERWVRYALPRRRRFAHDTSAIPFAFLTPTHAQGLNERVLIRAS